MQISYFVCGLGPARPCDIKIVDIAVKSHAPCPGILLQNHILFWQNTSLLPLDFANQWNYKFDYVWINTNHRKWNERTLKTRRGCSVGKPFFGLSRYYHVQRCFVVNWSSDVCHCLVNKVKACHDAEITSKCTYHAQNNYTSNIANLTNVGLFSAE